MATTYDANGREIETGQTPESPSTMRARMLVNGRAIVDELCQCGHRRSEHHDRFATGHGPCKRYCACKQFTWINWILADPDDVPSQKASETFLIWCRVTGGVTGTREGVLKRNGERATFATRAEAEAEAARLDKQMNHRYAVASFSYSVVRDA
jgi:hypothetical protein